MKKIIPTAVLIALTGCSGQMDCSNNDTKELISDIAKENKLLENGFVMLVTQETMKAGVDARDQDRLKQKPIIDKINIDIQSSTEKLDQAIKTCSETGFNHPAITKRQQELKILVDQYNKTAQSEKPKLPDINQFNYGPGQGQRASDDRRKAEYKYHDDEKKYYAKLDALKSDAGLKQSEIDANNSFIESECSLQKNTSDIVRPSNVAVDLYEYIASYHAKSIYPLKKEINDMRERLNSIEAGIEQTYNNGINNKTKEIVEKVKTAKYELENIITEDKNEKTGALSCKANLKLSIKDLGENSGVIRYKLEKTSEGKLYATINSIN